MIREISIIIQSNNCYINHNRIIPYNNDYNVIDNNIQQLFGENITISMLNYHFGFVDCGDLLNTRIEQSKFKNM